MTLKILYIHHAADFGGASRSLMELLLAFPEGHVNSIVMCPKGQFFNILRNYKINVFPVLGISQFDNTLYSHYRGFRWFILLRELTYLIPTIFALVKIKFRIKNIDIIHLNEITLSPVALIAKIIFSCPIVVHVRSLQLNKPSLRNFFLGIILRGCVTKFICIDETVGNSLTKEFNRVIIHNGFTSLKIAHEKQAKEIFRVAMVGAFQRSKGCLEFIEAANTLSKKYQNIRFCFYGNKPKNRFSVLNSILLKMGISHSIYDDMIEKINSFGINHIFEINDFTEDIAHIYQSIDLIAFPGFLNAPGRPIFEAGFFGVPSVLGIINPTKDTFVSGVTGLKITPGSVSELCNAIEYMYLNPDSRKIMGVNAKTLANKNFIATKNAAKVIATYKKILLR